MTEDSIYDQLYEKYVIEQDAYRKWLLSQPPEEILKHCYEYDIREDILMTFEFFEVDSKDAMALHSKGVTLDDLFHDFEDRETDHMQNIRDTIEERAQKIIREIGKGDR